MATFVGIDGDHPGSGGESDGDVTLGGFSAGWHVVAVWAEFNTASSVDSVSIGGVSGTALPLSNITGVGNANLFLFKVNVTGTGSLNVHWDYDSAGAWGGTAVVWAVSGEPGTVTDDAQDSTPVSNEVTVDVNVADGDDVFAFAAHNFNQAGITFTAGVTDDGTDYPPIYQVAGSETDPGADTTYTVTAETANGSWDREQLYVVSIPIASGSSGVTGTLSAQESGSDTASASGSVLVSGQVSAQEAGSDTAAASGTVLVSGTLAAQEAGDDTASVSGSVPVSGTLTAQESGADAASVSGSVLVSSTLAAQEAGSDVAQFVGNIGGAPSTGTMAAQEAGADTASASGGVLVSGALSASEAGTDTAGIAGGVLVSGALAVQEVGQDTARFVGEERSVAPIVIVGRPAPELSVIGRPFGAAEIVGAP